MLPVPIQADDHETRGLIDSDDGDVSPTLNNHPHITNIPINTTTSSLTSTNTPPQNNHNPPQQQNRVSRRDVNKRIASYLRESDENCRESATLVAIVIIGLIVTGSVIGFLQLGHYDPSSIHKGSHASVTHIDGEALPNSLPDWLTQKTNQIDEQVQNNSLLTDETLGIQPLYRNYLLQTLYEYSFQSAVRIDKNDPIFQHISMTYGGPWTVPNVPARSNDAKNQKKLRRSMQDNENDSDSDTEKVVWDEQSDIEMISLENGRNDHTFSLREYASNMNEWHCYIFEFANADQLVTNKEFWKDYTFKITSSIDNFDMESGYDFVRVYVNSQFKGQVFTGNIVQEAVVYRVDFEYLNDWNENDIPSLELCFNIVTDQSVTGKGFDITTKIEYENPEIVSWSDGDDNQCFIQQPTWRNPSRWDGTCGIGIKKKKIVKCNEDLLQNLQIQNVDENSNDELFESGLFRGVCTVNEEQISYCNKLDCGDASLQMKNQEIKSNPKLKYHFNGHGRIDPTYANPFDVYRSTNIEINIDEIVKEIESLKSDIEGEFPDKRILTSSVQKHKKMDDSKIRLGLKLARSLILGDTFHVVFTGSSNTAGHDNLFMSSYPMQLQSIMRPLWKRFGYKGAAFEVSNQAIGGAIGTDQMAWCIPAITGGNAEKIDVIFWESIMNDAGSDDSRRHTMEEHIRNSLSVYGGTYNNNMPNRPVWHAVIAGTNGDKPTEFDKNIRPIYSGYKDLIETYSNYGAGIVEFTPSLGMNPMKKKDPKNWSDEHFYVTWHPGPVGHRIYAEIIAYFYLDAVLNVLNDVKKTVKDLEKELDMVIARPVLEMLDLLQDAPYESGLPPTRGKKSKCKPLCTDAEHSYCMTGFNPKDNIYEISKYVVNQNKWKYELVAGNPQPIDVLEGGQASIDTKYGYKGNKNSGQLILSVVIVGNNYLLIEKPYADWGGLNEILKKMSEWFTVEIMEVMDIGISNPKQQKRKDRIIKQQIGRKLKCETKNKNIWNKDIINFGCVLKFEYSGKYKIALTVDTDDDIPICVIASF